MTGEGSTEAAGVKRRPQRWWVVVRHLNGAPELLVADRGGEKAVPVFGFSEEVELYWWLEDPGDSWQVQEYGTDELARVLGGLDAESVELDPLPGTLADGTAGLTRIGRGLFIDHILQQEALLEDHHTGERPRIIEL